MKNLLLLLTSLLSFHISAQQKYQSLLWEITGNGLEVPSYLYGTMHVSKKVAFRLDDVFFEALNQSECIALESDPSTWLGFNYKNSILNSGNTSYRGDFYRSLFKLAHPKETVVRRSIRLDSRLISGYLYRKDYGSDNFEEETYLDMFIYQAGKKQNKSIVGLEDLAESRYLTTKARYSSNKRKPDAWLQKLFKKENAFLIQENTYRERNLDLLDSIGAATNTPFFREHMLFKRNENMVNVLDSLMQIKSVFSGVGAAHLPGEKGMINMLVEKGYTVKPLTSAQTDYGKSEKAKLDNLLVQPKLFTQSTQDKFLTLKSFDTLREYSSNGQKYYLAPDMTNGAFLAITRINTYEYLPHDKPILLDNIDDLLYEDIPGTIIKKELLESPYPGISILNKTKKGDYQKYHIYKTPLEIIIIKFGGKKDYVLHYGDSIFSSITFKTESDGYTTLKDTHRKYSFSIPENYISENMGRAGKKLIQGKSNDDYFFFQESPHHDINYIEEDAFEAKYIHTAFYKNLEIEENDGLFENGDYKTYVSSSVMDSTSGKTLYLKSVVKDGSYYLLGYSGNHQEKAHSFFNSLKLRTPDYMSLKKVKDTSLYFTVNSTTKAPLSSYNRYNSKHKKPYDQQVRSTSYTSKGNEKVFVSRTKFHDLKMYDNIDSLWNGLTKKHDFTYASKANKKLEVFDEKRYKENGYHIFTHKLRDTASNKIVRIKYLQKEGVLYKLSSATDSISEPSSFITAFYDSFQPMDTLMGTDVFKDKSKQFFDALKNNDSIVLTAYKLLQFSKVHSPQIMETLENFEFPEDRTQIKLHLLQWLIKNDNSEAVTEFIKKLYLKSYSNPEIQEVILNSLVKRKEGNSYQLFLELMQKDLPLGSKIPRLYHYGEKEKSLDYLKPFLPEVLKLSNVQDYKTSVYSLLTKLVDSNVVKTKVYKSYKNQILNDAKIYLKRNLGFTKRYSSSRVTNRTLENYTKLLFPYRNEKQVKLFYLRLQESKDWEALTSYYVLLKQEGELIPNALKSKTLFKEPAQHLLYSKLKKRAFLGSEEISVINLETLAKSKLFANSDFKKPGDTIHFLKQKTFKTDTDKPVTLFIFKRINKRNKAENEYLHFIAFLEDNTEKPYYTSKKNGISILSIKTEDEIIEDTMLLVRHKTRMRIKQNRY